MASAFHLNGNLLKSSGSLHEAFLADVQPFNVFDFETVPVPRMKYHLFWGHNEFTITPDIEKQYN